MKKDVDYKLGIMSFLFIMIGSFIIRDIVEVTLFMFLGLVGIMLGGFLAALTFSENREE